MRLQTIGAIASCIGASVAQARSIHPHDPTFYFGHDLSSLAILEDGGAIYKDTAQHNRTRRAEDILADGGMNTVRLRLWVDPPSGQYNLPYVLALAKRFHAAGHHIYLDYHFSDDWADPQHNNAPAAWPTALEPLAATLRAYVARTLAAFAAADVPLALVSLGNEIRHGMLWPAGRADADVMPTAARVANFTGLATLVAAARAGVEDAVAAHAAPRPQVMLHVDNGWNRTLQATWFEALLATGRVRARDWDVFGFSFYPFYGTAATFANLRDSLGWVARRFGKPVHVVETDYPAICNGTALSEPSVPVSVEGQIEWVGEVINIVKGLPHGLGRGVHYWEPAWLNLTSLGSTCQDAILFDVDWSQYPTAIAFSRKSVDMFKVA